MSKDEIRERLSKRHDSEVSLQEMIYIYIYAGCMNELLNINEFNDLALQTTKLFLKLSKLLINFLF